MDISLKIKAIYDRHIARIARFDADDQEETEEEEKSGGGGGHGNTSLPYGIAKGAGIDTKGMTPHEVWEVLEGKGYSAKAAYAAIKEGKTGAAVGEAAKTGSDEKPPFPGFKKVGDKKYHVAKKDWNDDLLDKMPNGTILTIPEYKIKDGPTVKAVSYQYDDPTWHQIGPDAKPNNSFTPTSSNVTNGFFNFNLMNALTFSGKDVEIQYPDDGYVSPAGKKAAEMKQKKEAEAKQKKAATAQLLKKKGWKQNDDGTVVIPMSGFTKSTYDAFEDGTEMTIPGYGIVKKDGLWCRVYGINGTESQSLQFASLKSKIKGFGEVSAKFPDSITGNIGKEVSVSMANGMLSGGEKVKAEYNGKKTTFTVDKYMPEMLGGCYKAFAMIDGKYRTTYLTKDYIESLNEKFKGHL